MKRNIQKIKRIIKFVIIVVSLIILFFSAFIKNYFCEISFEQLLFNIIYSEGANYEIVIRGFIFVILPTIALITIFFVLNTKYKNTNTSIYFIFRFKTKSIRYKLFSHSALKSFFLITSMLVISVQIFVKTTGIDEFILMQSESTSLYDDNYISAKEVSLKFPNKKRNLIIIYSESLESTNISTLNGGNVAESYIPYLEQLALENVNFSNNDKIGGALSLNNTNWTMAALVSYSAGVPLKLSISANDYKGYSDSLPGVYNLGDILYDNGYKNYFMLGSNADFGGRRDYFLNHGNYTIYDYVYAQKENYIDDDYFVWWGYEDKKLFEFSKKKLLEISKNEEPFNFTMLTADTHFTDGYMDDSCEEIFNSKYANSFYCSDSKINSFIKWIKKQDFYNNTTIIIVGDHLTMQENFYDISNGYQRIIYNAFINSAVKPTNGKNRLFSTLDMFPTTLASIGVEIEGNKLGLGVNLFSDELTLIEKYSYEYINKEITKKSFYYDNVLLGNTYYEMQKDGESTKNN